MAFPIRTFSPAEASLSAAWTYPPLKPCWRRLIQFTSQSPATLLAAVLAGQGNRSLAHANLNETGPTILMMSAEGLRRLLRWVGNLLSPNEPPPPAAPVPEPPSGSHLRENIRGERVTCLNDILTYHERCHKVTLKYAASLGAKGPELRLGHPVAFSHPNLAHYRVIGAGMMEIKEIQNKEGLSRYRIKIDGASGFLRTYEDEIVIDKQMLDIGFLAARPCGLRIVRSILGEILKSSGDTVEII